MQTKGNATLVWLGDQWNKSNIMSGILAIAIWLTIIYLAIIGREPPDVLIGAGGIIIGFFFRAKPVA